MNKKNKTIGSFVANEFNRFVDDSVKRNERLIELINQKFFTEGKKTAYISGRVDHIFKKLDHLETEIVNSLARENGENGGDQRRWVNGGRAMSEGRRFQPKNRKWK